MLSSVEGYVKLWLVKVGKYEIAELKHKSFDDLVSKMEAVLKDKKN